MAAFMSDSPQVRFYSGGGGVLASATPRRSSRLRHMTRNAALYATLDGLALQQLPDGSFIAIGPGSGSARSGGSKGGNTTGSGNSRKRQQQRRKKKQAAAAGFVARVAQSLAGWRAWLARRAKAAVLPGSAQASSSSCSSLSAGPTPSAGDLGAGTAAAPTAAAAAAAAGVPTPKRNLMRALQRAAAPPTQRASMKKRRRSGGRR